MKLQTGNLAHLLQQNPTQAQASRKRGTECPSVLRVARQSQLLPAGLNRFGSQPWWK